VKTGEQKCMEKRENREQKCMEKCENRGTEMYGEV
jgi:hypothetical protein